MVEQHTQVWVLNWTAWRKRVRLRRAPSGFPSLTLCRDGCEPSAAAEHEPCQTSKVGAVAGIFLRRRRMATIVKIGGKAKNGFTLSEKRLTWSLG
jgi:hypothetical protein